MDWQPRYAVRSKEGNIKSSRIFNKREGTKLLTLTRLTSLGKVCELSVAPLVDGPMKMGCPLFGLADTLRCKNNKGIFYDSEFTEKEKAQNC